MLRRRLIGMVILALVSLAVVAWLLGERGREAAGQREGRERRRLFAAEARDDILEVRLDNPKGAFVLERVGQRWKITAPFATEADASAVQGILNHAFGLEQMPLEEEVDLSAVGLDPPLHSLQIIARSGRSWRLTVGRRNTFDDTVYVRRGDAPTVGLAPSALLYQVSMDLFQLRERRVLPFEPGDVRAVRVRGTDGSWMLERDGEDFWLGGDAREPADPEQAERVIRDLVSIRVASFVSDRVTPEALEELGTAPVGIRVEVDDLAGTHVLLLGGADPDNPEQVLVHRLGTSTLASVPLSALRSLHAARAATLRDRRVIPFARDSVYGILLAGPDGEIRFARIAMPQAGRDGWQLEGPQSYPARDAEVFGLLYRLWTLRFDPDLMVAAAEVPARAGLQTPRRLVRLFDRAGEELAGFAVGAVELDGAWVRSSDGRIGKVPAGRIEAISFALEAYRADAE